MPEYLRSRAQLLMPCLQTPEAVKQRLQSILSSNPDFSPPKQTESEISKEIRKEVDRFGKAWKSFTNWLEKWWDRVNELFSGGAIKASGNLFIGLFIACCCLVSGYLIWKYLLQRQSGKSSSTGVRTSASQLMEDDLDVALSKSAEEWVLEANRHAKEEDYRLAIRAIFLSLIRVLDDEGLLEYTRSSTNGDLLVGLISHDVKHVGAPFRRLVNQYEFIWYGENNAGEAEYASCKEEYKQISDSLAAGVAPALNKIGAAIAN